MKVLYNGLINYRTPCRNCESVLEFSNHDVFKDKIHGFKTTFKNGDIVTGLLPEERDFIKCPVCENHIDVSRRNYGMII